MRRFVLILTILTGLAAGASAREPDGPLLILRGATFDPVEGVPVLEGLGFGEPRSGDYGIVQFHVGRESSRRQLAGDDLVFLGYLPHGAYQVRWTREGRKRAASHPDVRWAGDIPPALKVAPQLWPRVSPAEVDGITVIAFDRDALEQVTEVLDRGARVEAHQPVPDAVFPRALYRVPPRAVATFVRRAAGLDGVAWIEPFRRPRLLNSDSVGPIQANMPTGPGATPLWDRGLIGTGQVVAVADSGLDRHQCWFTQHVSPAGALNSAVTDAEQPPGGVVGTLFGDRKVVGYWLQAAATAYDNDETCPGTSDSTGFHGTHVAGTVAGDRGVASSPLAPGASFLAADRDGMAPNAQLLFQDIGNDTSGCLSLPLDLGELLSQAHGGGARLHNNSWGASTGGEYVSADREIDHALWRLEDLLAVFAAGNEGAFPAPDTPQTINSPGNAKNVLTVGALEHGDSLQIAGFSSRGPTADGRVKPDIVAPGVAIQSAAGDTDNSTPSCPAPSTLSGTSMATPTVTGGAALVRQYFTDGFYPTGAAAIADARSSSGALIKAVLINGTHGLGDLPTFDTGWGRAWLHRSVPFDTDPQRLRTWSKRHASGLATGDVDAYEVASQGGELRVTLAWLDPAATPGAGQTLVNDLDLEVEDPAGNVFRGNMLSGGVSQAGGPADVLNTVEHVRLPATTPGIYRLRVIGSSVPGTGLLFEDRQGYGLAAVADECTPPTDPITGFAALSDGETGIELFWQAVAGATRYHVYRAEGDCSASDDAFELIATAAGAGFLDATAGGGQRWAYRVRAADGCGEGPLSACAATLSTVPVELPLCSAEPGDWPPRPRWQDVLGPNNYPDYRNVSNNFNVIQSLRLLGGILTRVISALDGSQLTTDEITGLCVCNAGQQSPQMLEDLTREACNDQCTDVVVWLPTDIFQDPQSAALYTLELFDYLEDIREFLDDEAGPLVEALERINSGIEDLEQLLDQLLAYVDRFTEGYHLGDYSTQRPDLHLCVGYAGHGAFSELADLLGGDVRIGGRYTSHNLSSRHRAQFRSGGFGVEAFGKTFSLAPSVEGNLQFDGFRLWDAQRPFGIGLPENFPGIPLEQANDWDFLNLVDDDLLAEIAGNDQVIEFGEFLIKDFYPVRYTPQGSSSVFEWPRSVAEEPWEGPSIAVFSAGLNLSLTLARIEKDLPPIPVGPFLIVPDFRLDAELGWFHETNLFRDRLEKMIELNLGFDIGDDFARPQHAFQADDLTAENGNRILVRPEIGASLRADFGLTRWAALSLALRLGVGVQLEPSAHAGIADLSRSLKDHLLASNPPAGEECSPDDYDVETTSECSNTLWEESQAELSCEAGGEGEDVEACADLGRCVSIQDGGPATLRWDVRAEECTTLRPDQDEILPDDVRGACCEAGGCRDNAFHRQCRRTAGVFHPGKTCAEVDCDAILAFVPYRCLDRIRVEPSSWSGPGCPPLSTGFPSACGCASDEDCQSGETCSEQGVCESPGFGCFCESGTQCAPERVCVGGACLARCSSNTDCGGGLVCDSATGGCVSAFDIPFAEQVAFGLQDTAAPSHTVWTHAFSEMEAFSYFSASLHLELALRIFRRTRSFTILDISDWWQLFAALSADYQPGLEAEYENDCAPEFGRVSNRQPGEDFVSRYNPQEAELIPGAPLSAYDDNAGSWQELLGWCRGELPQSAVNPDAPDVSSLATDIENLVEWSEDVALEVFEGGQLCVGGQPLGDWLQLLQTNPAGLSCSYGGGASFPCGRADRSVLRELGCLDADANAFAVEIAERFGDLVSVDGGRRFFDLDAMLIDPGDAVTRENVKPQIRSLTVGGVPVGELWIASVEQCFDARFDAEKLVAGLEVGPCCGNGVRNDPEQCDDGNTDSGDGCNSICRLEEGSGCPDPDDPTVSYVSFEPSLCAPGDVMCPEGQLPFSNKCGCGCSGAPSCVAPPAGMAAWWPLDESSGTAVVDRVHPDGGEAEPGEVGLTGPGNVTGVVGGGFSFDGVDDLIEVADRPSLDFEAGDDLSIDFWIRTEQQLGSVLDKRVTPGSGSLSFSPSLGYQIFLHDGRIGLQLADGKGSSACSPRPESSCTNFVSDFRAADGEWHHVAVTVDRDDVAGGRFYIDGIERTTARFDPTVRSGSLANDQPLFLAAHAATGRGSLRGALDEVEIFRRALSESEVRSLFASGRHGKCVCVRAPEGLDAWWTFDRVSGDQTFDQIAGAVGSLHGASPAPGRVGQGLALDAPGAFTDFAHGPATDVADGDFSIDFWVRTRAASGVQTMLDKRVSQPAFRGYSLYLFRGRLGLQLSDGTFRNYNSDFEVADGAWHHVAVTVDRDDPEGIRFYLDGRPASRAFDPRPRSGSLSNEAPLRLGGNAFDTRGHWVGTIDELETFHRVLLPEEVRAIAEAGGAGKCRCLDPHDPHVDYVSHDPTLCSTIRFVCAPGQRGFSNECGCGCFGEALCPIGTPWAQARGIHYPDLDCAAAEQAAEAESSLTSFHYRKACQDAVAGPLPEAVLNAGVTDCRSDPDGGVYVDVDVCCP